MAVDFMNDRWKIKEPIDFKKREILFMMFEAFNIPHNVGLREGSHWTYLGVWKHTFCIVDKNVPRFNTPHVLGLGTSKDNELHSLFSDEENIEVSVDEVIESMQKYLSDESFRKALDDKTTNTK